MRGSDLVAWRKIHGYSRSRLLGELGVKSRQTLSTWENSDEIPRLLELALLALARIPECRETNVGGKHITKSERLQYSPRIKYSPNKDEKEA